MNMDNDDGIIGFESPGGPLTSDGVDFSNKSQALDFLDQMLDDTDLQITGNKYARDFWFGIVVLIGVAAILNFIWLIRLKIKLQAALHSKVVSTPSRNLLKNIFALCRYVSYQQLPPKRVTAWLRIPPLGTLLLLLAYLGFILALQFDVNNIAGAQHYTALGIRAGWLAIAQIPLLILLAGKNNLIGLFTGVSYERLNILHRWVARGLLLLATLHLGYQNHGWNKYGLMQLEWSSDTCPPTGIAAYSLLFWLNISTLIPIRGFSYEIFVFQHLITFFGFIIAIMIHLPTTALYTRVYIWTAIGLYLLDRLVRFIRLIYHNSRLGYATPLALSGDVTKVTISPNRCKSWSPGSFVLLSFPRLGPGQSHPATILSTPTSHNGAMVFLLKTNKGFTRRLQRASSPLEHTNVREYMVIVDGPYGSSQPDFVAFDSALLIAGSTGITFTLSLLLNFAQRSTTQKLPLRRIDMVWCVKEHEWTSWVSSELIGAVQQLKAGGIGIFIRIFITADEAFSGSDDQEVIQQSSVGIIMPQLSYKGSPKASGERQSGSSGEMLSEVAYLRAGRPNCDALVAEAVTAAVGVLGVVVCGPKGLVVDVRGAVAGVQFKGEVVLHAETFGW